MRWLRKRLISEWGWVPLAGFLGALGMIVLGLADPFGLFNRWNPDRIEAVTLAVLVIITAVYAFFTHRMALEMKATRQDSLRPLLLLGNMAATLDKLPKRPPPDAMIIEQPDKSVGVRFGGYVANIGPGPAVRGSILIRVGTSPVEKHISQGSPNQKELPPLASGQTADVSVYATIPGTSRGAALPEHGELLVTYHDIYDRRIQCRYPLTRGSVTSGDKVSGEYRLGSPEITVV